MLEIFEALGIDEPDLIFHFARNHGIAPPEKEEEKSIGYWRHQFDAKNSTNKKAFANPLDSADAGKIRNHESNVENLFSAIADFKSTLFLITKPFRGNRLSEIACRALRESESTKIETLGLFHTDSDHAEGQLTVLKDFKDLSTGTRYEKELIEEIKKEREKDEWSKRLQFDENGQARVNIPGAIFELNSVPYGNEPKNTIKVDCGFTDYEERQYRNNNYVTDIPGGLANECSHRLIFTSKRRMKEFEKVFCESYPTGYFACGGSSSEMKTAKQALQNGKPLFAIEGTGVVPTIVNHFVNSEDAYHGQTGFLAATRSKEIEKILCRMHRRGKQENENEKENSMFRLHRRGKQYNEEVLREFVVSIQRSL